MILTPQKTCLVYKENDEYSLKSSSFKKKEKRTFNIPLHHYKRGKGRIKLNVKNSWTKFNLPAENQINSLINQTLISISEFNT